jgi:hypothetical protein
LRPDFVCARRKVAFAGLTSNRAFAVMARLRAYLLIADSM